MAGCSKAPEQLVYNGLTMGTTYQVKIVPGDTPVPEDMGALIDSTLQRLDATFTTYRPDSELMKMNSAQVGESFPLSPDMLRVIQVSREVFQLTGGAFDPTVAPLVNLWGFGPDPALDKVPPKSSINHQLARVGLNKLSVDDDAGNARRTREIQLDLSAVAKGYAVDVVADMLTARGLTNYLVEVGGELRISGHKAGQKSWRIAIESPEENRHEVQQALTPGDAGIATSGDYRNYFERDGKRYSHTIDPRTGYPVTHQLASVTVIAERTAYADAMATALMVMGQREALALAEKNDLAVYLLVKEGDGFKSYASPAFVPYLSGE